MSNPKNKSSFAKNSAGLENLTGGYVVPHHPPLILNQPNRAGFLLKKQFGDTLGTHFLNAVKRTMKPSEPRLNKLNDKKWFIYWNHDVPYQLWETYPRKRLRIKKYENLNRLSGQEREKHANLMLKVWKYRLQVENYNPFAEELKHVFDMNHKIKTVDAEIQEVDDLIYEKNKNNTNILKALSQFIASRIERTDNTNSHSTHRGLIKWFTKYLKDFELLHLSVGQIKRQHIADALLYTKKEKSWSASTYNNNVDMINTAFNWFAMEEYIDKNPATGKIAKLKVTVSKNTWYQKDVAAPLKLYMKNNKHDIVYHACAFTYHLCVRSQQELLKLKISDLDFNLKRIRFRKEVSKNGLEAYRDFTPAFEQICTEMKLQQKPADFYIFGSGGGPSAKRAGKNTIASAYKKIKDKLKLGENYTIYGWKHTRVIHEMMKGTDPYEIQHICRHSSLEETQKYMRGFDLSLRKVYADEDLTF